MVTPGNIEVKSNTAAVIECSISGISALATVVWRNSAAVDLNGADGYTVAAGTFDSGSQVSTLSLIAAKNDQDATYTCDVTAPGTGQTAQSTTVDLNVFGGYRNLKLF